MTNLSEDDIVLAGEYVLGLLDNAGDATANARMATDADFAAEVEAWRQRLTPMFSHDEAPPSHVWAALETALPISSGQDISPKKLTFWRAMTGLSVSAAAIMGVLLLQKPDIVKPSSVDTAERTTPMIAALGSDNGKAALTASFDARSGQMIVTPVALDTGNLYPELWVIPADGKPRSLGMIDRKSASLITIPTDLRSSFSVGSTLAVTPELQSGGPGGQPSGPVMASGKITLI